MRLCKLAVLALLLALPSAAWGVDDGQTQPRFTYASLTTWNTSTDIIGTTSGSGNVKGVHCLLAPGTTVVISFYVNGGAAQSVTLDSFNFPVDANSNSSTGWIPYNIRFSSSIRVQMRRPLSPVVAGDTPCAVSWALD